MEAQQLNEANTCCPPDMRPRLRYKPPVDIFESADELVIVADIPGSSSEDIAVEFAKGVLSIRAEMARKERKRMLVEEWRTGVYERVFEISEQIDADRIAAEYREGVLRVTLPKSTAAKLRKIEVKS